MIFSTFFVMPMAAGAAVEYGCCRVPKRKFWRYLPPVVTGAATAAIGLFRYHNWSAGAEKAPIETLLFIPGLPALGVFLGLLVGYRIWKWVWTPKVVREGKGKKETGSGTERQDE